MLREIYFATSFELRNTVEILKKPAFKAECNKMI